MRLALFLAAVALCGCKREKELRNKECAQFAEWSNHTGDALSQAVPDAEKAAAQTYEAQAAINRRLAEGAKTGIPFTDPYVHGLAVSWLKVFDNVALALDHAADGWAKGDKQAVENAVREEMLAKGAQKSISDEWLAHCRL